MEGQPTKEQLADQRIMRALVDGDPAALEALYDSYGTVALAVIARIVHDRRVAEELLQELFLRIWQRAGSYRDDRGQVRSWILGIAHNLALNELRRQRRRPPTVEPPPDSADGEGARDPMLHAPDPAPGPDEIAWMRERRRQLGGGIAALPQAQRAVIELYAAGHSQSEIAGQLGEPLGTVKSRMRRALLQLRGSLHELGMEP